MNRPQEILKFPISARSKAEFLLPSALPRISAYHIRLIKILGSLFQKRASANLLTMRSVTFCTFIEGEDSMKRLVSFLLIACAGFVVIPNLTAAQDGMKPTVSAKLRERRIAYRDALLKVINLVHRMHQEGQLSIDRLINAQTELGNAESAVTSEPEKCIQKLEANLDPLKKLEAFQKEGAYSNWFGTTGRASRKHGRAYSRGDHAS